MYCVCISNRLIPLGPVAQLVRASPCHGEGRRFESDLGRSHLFAPQTRDSSKLFHRKVLNNCQRQLILSQLQRINYTKEVTKTQIYTEDYWYCLTIYDCSTSQMFYSVKIGFGILAQLGEHLPYKQRVIGSSPIGPTNTVNCQIYGCVLKFVVCWCGGTGRRAGLKIPWWRHRTGSIPVTSSCKK